MPIGQRVGGVFSFTAAGERLEVKGNWTWNLGLPVRAGVVGADAVHGFTETPQIAFVEGVITLGQVDPSVIATLKNATCTLELATGMIIGGTNCYYAGDGNGTTEAGEFNVRFEGDFKKL